MPVPTTALPRPAACLPVSGRLVLQDRDARADEGRRTVVVTPEGVAIARSLRGIPMRVAVPVGAYEGVCVGVRAAPAGRFAYELRLRHRDPDLSVMLAEAFDEEAIWSDGRAWAAFLGLPALVERNDGPERADGALARTPAPALPRRLRRRRRPGIVTRRLVRAGATETVHHEAEIIART